MCWIVVLAIMISCIWTKDTSMFHTAGLFAIAGAIESLAIKFNKK